MYEGGDVRRSIRASWRGTALRIPLFLLADHTLGDCLDFGHFHEMKAHQKDREVYWSSNCSWYPMHRSEKERNKTKTNPEPIFGQNLEIYIKS